MRKYYYFPIGIVLYINAYKVTLVKIIVTYVYEIIFLYILYPSKFLLECQFFVSFFKVKKFLTRRLCLPVCLIQESKLKCKNIICYSFKENFLRLYLEESLITLLSIFLFQEFSSSCHPTWILVDLEDNEQKNDLGATSRLILGKDFFFKVLYYLGPLFGH